MEIAYRVLPALIKYQVQIFLIMMASHRQEKIALVMHHQHNSVFVGEVETGQQRCHFHVVLCNC